jgi:uncharacterized protein (TIGR03437 family)
VHADGTRTNSLAATCPTPASCVAAPLNLGSPSDQAYLSLYCSGVRAHRTSVSVIVGATTIAAMYAGPQNQFPGMDQVNIQLPRSLSGAGLVNVRLVVDGADSNPVEVQIQ